MSDIEITAAMLADIEDKCKRLMALKELETTAYYDYWRELITPDNTLGPAVVLAMIAQITFLHTLLFGDMLPPDDPVFRAEELDKEVKELRDEVERLREERQEAVDALHQWVWGVEHDDKTEVENAFEQAKEIVKKEGAE